MTVTMTDLAKQEKETAKTAGEEVEVMELRLYLEDGKIRWVEPIDSPDVQGSKATGKNYTVDFIQDLKNEGKGIRQISAVAFQQDSPACSYWYVYQTKTGIVKICLG